MKQNEDSHKGIGINREGWVYGFLFKNEGRSWILIPNEQFLNTPQMIEVYTDSVCRFTGVYDLNRRPLYENDEITVDSYATSIFFDEGSFYHTAYSDFDYLSHGEIIYTGNIFNEKYGIKTSEDTKKFLSKSNTKGFVEYTGEDQNFVDFSIRSNPLDHITLGIGTEDHLAYLTVSQVAEVIAVLRNFVEEGEI